MRKELQNVLNKKVEDLTEEEAKRYYNTLKLKKFNNLTIILAFIGVGATSFTMLIFGLLQGVSACLTAGMAALLAAIAVEYFTLAVVDAKNHDIASNCINFLSFKEKREFKKAKGMEKIKQLLEEYIRLHGTKFLYPEEKNDEELENDETFDFYKKSINAKTSQDANKGKTKNKTANNSAAANNTADKNNNIHNRL